MSLVLLVLILENFLHLRDVIYHVEHTSQHLHVHRILFIQLHRQQGPNFALDHSFVVNDSLVLRVNQLLIRGNLSLCGRQSSCELLIDVIGSFRQLL